MLTAHILKNRCIGIQGIVAGKDVVVTSQPEIGVNRLANDSVPLKGKLVQNLRVPIFSRNTIQKRNNYNAVFKCVISRTGRSAWFVAIMNFPWYRNFVYDRYFLSA